MSQLLTAAQAAARLGVKRQTLYAYVSRGLLGRTVAIDGRTSLFDPAELDELRMGKSARRDGELRTLISTEITQVSDEVLAIRGVDLVALAESANTDGGFTTVIDELWQAPAGEEWPAAEPDLRTELIGVDGLRTLVALASSTDSLRHDLSPFAVRAAGRRIVTALVHGLPTTARGSDGTAAAALWRRLTKRRGSAAERNTLDLALSLLVDHGLASSTFAARIAASVRADPYSCVTAGLGVIGGPLHGAASAAVHALLEDAARRDDPAAAVGERLRDGDRLPGFGHAVYTGTDPRYVSLMAAVVQAWADDPRLSHIYRLRDVVAERRTDAPNIDLALGSLTWLSGMEAGAGETIFAVARSAGWIAHAMEEYGEAPLRFRPKARYTGLR